MPRDHYKNFTICIEAILTGWMQLFIQDSVIENRLSQKHPHASKAYDVEVISEDKSNNIVKAKNVIWKKTAIR